MSHDKLANYLIARISTRETVSVAITIFVSSASVVLLGVIWDNSNQPHHLVALLAIGYGFPIVAIIYNEITYLSIHKNELDTIRKIIRCYDDSDIDGNESKKKDCMIDSEEILTYSKLRVPRYFLMRLMLFTPIFGWTVLLPVNIECKIGLLVIITIIIIMMTIIVMKKTNPKTNQLNHET